MFQLPLSQGLLRYKVYIYSKSISHKIGTNLAQKYVYEKYCYDSSGPEFLYLGADFHTTECSKIRLNSGPGQHHSGPELAVSINLNFSNFESLSQHIWICYYFSFCVANHLAETYEVCYLFLQVGILMESHWSLLYIKVLWYDLHYWLQPRHKYFLISL